jgi:SAM-dependent methyltransferase
MPATRDATNYWLDSACARAFWGQQDLPPYRQLLADTAAWLDPHTGEHWLDLGCGSGALTAALWERSGGTVGGVLALDCAAVNARTFGRRLGRLRPAVPGGRLRFAAADFLSGLAGVPSASIDGVVSGLAIQYAESFDEDAGRWTSAAYDATLAAVFRVLRPGGRFVFSVNVPEPRWGRVAAGSLLGVFGAARPLRYLRKCRRMWSYGGWLKRQARLGRFHYLDLPVIAGKLRDVGFAAVEHRLSYAGQAYLIRCRKG